MELITKKITKAGNSSNVLLPKEWLGGIAKVELIEKPINIPEDIIKILNPYLKNIIGIYLVGSYARKEQTEKSDIDVLVITNKENKKIDEGKYQIMLISEETLKKTLKQNILPLLPMLKESKAILNEELIEAYKNIKLSKANLKWHITTTKSALGINKGLIELAERENENISDGIIYSLILRLREAYIVNCLKNDAIPSNQGIKQLVKDLTKSTKSYEAYLRSKAEEKDKKDITPETARKIYNYIKDKITIQA